MINFQGHPEEQEPLDASTAGYTESSRSREVREKKEDKKASPSANKSSDNKKSSSRSKSVSPDRSVTITLPSMELKVHDFCICPCGPPHRKLCYKPVAKGSTNCHGCDNHFG